MTNGIKNRRGNAFPNANFKPGSGPNKDDLRVSEQIQEKVNIDSFYKMEDDYSKMAKGKKFNDPSLKTAQEKMADYAFMYNNSPKCPDGACISYDDLGHFGNKRIQIKQQNTQQ